MTGRRPTPEDFGWSAEDLRSAYAVDGSGPYRYAPDGSGPFSYDADGSGPWLVGPDPRSGPTRFAPRRRRGRAGLRRIGSACAAGTLALGLVVGSVAALAHTVPAARPANASSLHAPGLDGD